jgi:hypothetical protein
VNASAVFSVLNSVLDRINNWRWKRYPSLVVTLIHQDRTAFARVATFGHPIFIRFVRFKLPNQDKAEEVVAVNQMLSPHGQVDCAIPRRMRDRLVLTDDLAVSALYRTESGRETESDAPIFNLVGGDGQTLKVEASGNYIGWGKCPKCGNDAVFGTSGVANVKKLNQRRGAFERDLKKTCPDHDRSRQKFW